jgi:hypothetical protein
MLRNLQGSLKSVKIKIKLLINTLSRHQHPAVRPGRKAEQFSEA